LPHVIIHMLDISSETIVYVLKEYQSLIGTVVGFIGVCITLWYNAHVAERRRTKEIAHQRMTSRVALTSELSAIQTTLKSWKQALDKLADQGEVGLPRPFNAEGASRAYRAVLPTIGLLTESEIEKAVLAYSQYENLSTMARQMQEDFDPSKPDKAMSLAFKAYVHALSNTLEAVNDALDIINEAKVIEKANQDARERKF